MPAKKKNYTSINQIRELKRKLLLAETALVEEKAQVRAWHNQAEKAVEHTRCLEGQLRVAVDLGEDCVKYKRAWDSLTSLLQRIAPGWWLRNTAGTFGQSVLAAVESLATRKKESEDQINIKATQIRALEESLRRSQADYKHLEETLDSANRELARRAELSESNRQGAGAWQAIHALLCGRMPNYYGVGLEVCGRERALKAITTLLDSYDTRDARAGTIARQTEIFRESHEILRKAGLHSETSCENIQTRLQRVVDKFLELQQREKACHDLLGGRFLIAGEVDQKVAQMLAAFDREVKTAADASRQLTELKSLPGIDSAETARLQGQTRRWIAIYQAMNQLFPGWSKGSRCDGGYAATGTASDGMLQDLLSALRAASKQANIVHSEASCRIINELQADVKQYRTVLQERNEIMDKLRNSVCEACAYLPNVATFVRQVERERDEWRKRWDELNISVQMRDLRPSRW